MKLLIISDQDAFCQDLSDALKDYADMQVLGGASSAAQALEQMRAWQAEVVLLDCKISGGGLAVARVLLKDHPQAQIVILVEQSGDPENVLAAVRLGVKGYLPRTIAADKLAAALRGMQRGEAPLSREMTAHLITQVAQSQGNPPAAAPDPLAPLTAREMEVLSEISGGMTNREIADQLVVSENTVRNHVHNLLEKLGLHSRREAGLIGRRCGLAPKQDRRA